MGKKEQKSNETQQKHSAQEDKLVELTDMLKRTQANFENYRKQTEKRIEDIHKFAARNVLTNILPLLDNFTLALKNQQGSKEDILTGVEMIYSQLLSVLKDQGVQPIQVGEQFDPATQEPLMKVASQQPENTVLEVIQQGYTLHGNILRAARVKLSAGPAKQESQSDNQEQPQQNTNDTEA